MLTATVQITLAISLALCITSCGPDVDTARKTFARISTDRVIGSTCSANDSASIKRAEMHPLGPTGGWTNQTNKVDYTRTLDRDTNSLSMGSGGISGYVKFDKPGHLQARSYDDYFGNVYCGWAPEKLALKPTEKPVFVTLASCVVGDGGLDQIDEVAWFPEGKTEGTIIFSSAHKTDGPGLRAIDTFRPELLTPYRFDENQAAEVLQDHLRVANLPAANQALEQFVESLKSQKDSIDGSTRMPIPSEQLNRESWNLILATKLGMELGEPNFDTTMLAAQKNATGPNRSSHYQIDTFLKMVPLYDWLDDAVKGKKNCDVDPARLSKNTSDRDPIAIVKYMKTGTFSRYNMKWGTGPFWVGARSYLNGDSGAALIELKKYLAEPHGSYDAFEVAAAAKLIDRIKSGKITPHEIVRPKK